MNIPKLLYYLSCLECPKKIMEDPELTAIWLRKAKSIYIDITPEEYISITGCEVCSYTKWHFDVLVLPNLKKVPGIPEANWCSTYEGALNEGIRIAIEYLLYKELRDG